MFIKPEKVVIKRLDLDDPEKIKLVDKLQEDMQDHKLTTKALRDQLLVVMQEQKWQNEIQEGLVRKQEELERNMHKHHEESLAKQAELAQEQAKTNAGIAALLEMMQKQHKP